MVCGLLFSVFMVLAFPPVGIGSVSFAFAPLVWCAARTRLPWRAGLFAGIGSTPFWAFEHRWLVDVSVAGFPALVAYLSLYPALFVWIMGRAGRRWTLSAHPILWLVLAPTVWVGLEVLRSDILFHGYPWFRLATPADRYMPVVAAWGVSAASWRVALGGALLGNLLFYWRTYKRPPGPERSESERRRWRRGVTWFVLIVFVSPLLFLIGWAGLYASTSTRAVTIGVLQTDVPQSNKIAWSPEQKKADFDRFIELTREGATGPQAPSVDLIVWPETMFPGMALDPDAVAVERAARLRYPDGTPTTYFHDRLLELQRELGIPMLVGALGVEGLRIEIDDDTGQVSVDQDALFNSVFLIIDGAVSPTRYDKLHLTPFGEVMPYISASDWLESKLLAIGASGMSFGLDAGKAPVIFEIPDLAFDWQTGQRSAVRIATPICFEGTMPQVMRRLVRGAVGQAPADLIIQLSNDGWFGGWTGGRAQHRQLMAWTAAEQRLPVVRAVNTGISCLLTPDGRPSPTAPDDNLPTPYAEPHTERFVPMRVFLPDGGHPFVFLGDIIDWLTLAFTALAFILPMVPAGARSTGVGRGVDVAGSSQGSVHVQEPDRQEHAADDAEPDPRGSA